MHRHLLPALLAASCLAPTAQAASIQASGFGSQAVEVSFATLPLSFGGTPQVVAGGLTFESGAHSFRTYPGTAFGPFYGVPGVEVCAERGCIMTDVELDFISVDLPSPVARVGALIGIPNRASTARAEFYAGTTLLGSIDVAPAAFIGEFAGWDAGANLITRVRFVDTINQGFVLAMTGFTYEFAAAVPEPATAMLSLLGLAVVGVSARRLRPADLRRG